MNSFQEALDIALNAVPDPKITRLASKKCLNRILAENLILNRNFPDTRLSAVDGFAFRVGDVSVYQIMGNVGAGSYPEFSLQPGQCAAVMTGAPVPEGTDCVVRVEECTVDSDSVRTDVLLTAGDLINEVASEAAIGTLLASAGSVINKALFPTIFYAGFPAVQVYDRPKIGMLLTGDELVDVGVEPQKGQVFNTNCYILQSVLDALHLEITLQIQARDDETETLTSFRRLADHCDIIVSSGGVSMGQFDFVKKTFREQDFNLLIQSTGIKPGRPLMLAETGGKLFFGMPGYPAAFLTNCLAYLVPALKKACGRTDYCHRLIEAKLATPLKSRKGTLYLSRIRLEPGEDGWIASDPGSQTTSHFLNFSGVNGLAFLSEETGPLKTGDTIKCLHFDLELS